MAPLTPATAPTGAGKKPAATPFMPGFTLDPGNRSLRNRKAELRHELRHRRKVIPRDLQDTTRWKVTNHLRSLLGEISPRVIALYYPQGEEIDLLPLARELWQQDFAVALPRTVARGHPLAFNLWAPYTTLEPDALGIPCATGPEVMPGVMIVPMLGYHRKGYRLGYGAGYYDRTLREFPLPVMTIGVCYTELEIEDFPKEYHDFRLGYIVTGKEVIICQ